MNAMWSVLGYQNYPAPTPAVCVIKLRNEFFIIDQRNRNQIVDLDVYFSAKSPNAPQEVANMKLVDFFETYNYSKDINVQRQNQYRVNVGNIPVAIYKRQRTQTSSNVPTRLVRIKSYKYRIGEDFYMRLLFLNNRSKILEP